MLLHGDFLRIQYYSLVARRASGTYNFHPSLARHLKQHHYKFCFLIAVSGAGVLQFFQVL